MSDSSGNDTWIYVALGCGGLTLLTLCLLPFGALGYRLMSDSPPEIVDEPRPVSPPGPPPAPPTPPPGPFPPPNPGLNPPAPPPPTTAANSRRVEMEITEAQGIGAISAGSTCGFDVERHDRPDGTFWCRAQVNCGGTLLYGGANAGYFNCTLYEQPERHVVGQDTDTTSGDTDAAFRIDTLRQEVEVRDDASGANGAFTIRGRVTSVR